MPEQMDLFKTSFSWEQNFRKYFSSRELYNLKLWNVVFYPQLCYCRFQYMNNVIYCIVSVVLYVLV